MRNGLFRRYLSLAMSVITAALLCDSAAHGQQIQLYPAIMLDSVPGPTFSQPSLAIDSENVLIYALRQSSSDFEPVGFQIADLTRPETYVSLGPIADDRGVLDAWLAGTEIGNILLWISDRRIDAEFPPAAESTFLYLTIFHSDSPSSIDLAQSILLQMGRGQYSSPLHWDVRSLVKDSILYLEFTDVDWLGWTVVDHHQVKAVNFVTNQLQPFQVGPHNFYASGHGSGGRSEFIRIGNTVSILDPNLFCMLYFELEQECWHPRVEYRLHAIAPDSIDDVGVVIDSEIIADENTWYDIRGFSADSTHYFALRGEREIRKLHEPTGELEFVCSVSAARSENLLPVSLRDGFAVLAVNRNHAYDHLELFDRQWTHVGSQSIAYAGDSVANVWIVAQPGAQTFAIGYTAVATAPYNQRRLFLQTGEARIPTDADGLSTDPVPGDFALEQNYPNPFNGQTIISFALPARTPTVLDIFNLSGQRIRRLAMRDMSAGAHTVAWDGTDDHGCEVASGIYLYRLEAGKLIQSRKMLMLK